MKEQSIQHILFDFDGTIVDSEAAFAVSDGALLNAVLVRAGFNARLSEGEIRALAGRGAEEKIDWLIDRYQLDAAQCRDRFLLERKAKRPSLMRDMEVLPNPGVADFLQQYGERCGIASNKNLEKLRNDLEQLGILPYFSERTYGAEGRLPKKPAPDLLLHAMEALGFSADDTIYVGDLPIDIEAAACAGMVAFGFAAPSARDEEVQALHDAGACLVLRDMMELVPYMQGEC